MHKIILVDDECACFPWNDAIESQRLRRGGVELDHVVQKGSLGRWCLSNQPCKEEGEMYSKKREWLWQMPWGEVSARCI